MTRAHPRTVLVSGVALLLFAGSLALFWPGVAAYDSVWQFDQALSGQYEDWHPPAMARVWAALHRGFGGHAEPMLVLQMGLYWAGLGSLAATLARIGRVRAAAAILAIGALPLFVGWQAVVLKDTQMVGAMLAACGLVGWWRLRATSVPAWGWAMVGGLLAYATLVRANAVFATVPFAVMLVAPMRLWLRAVVCVVGVAAVLGVAPLINHGLLGAKPTGVERTEAFYDLAGIAVRDPDTAIGLTPAEARSLARKHCVKALFWDPLGDETRCAPTMARLHALNAGQLYRLLAQAVLRHPVDYAAHRIAHLNSTGRWFVPRDWPSGGPVARSEPNSFGLATPGPAARGWQAVAKGMAETPLGWPIAWLVVALTGLTAAVRQRPSPPRDLALALFVSALGLEASFGVISIASDLRYHLWPMLATALACVLLAGQSRWHRATVMGGGMVLACVLIAGIAARFTLAPLPPGYQAWLQ